MEVSKECSAFALYGGVSGETSAARFYDLIMKWHEELGFVPDVLSVTRPREGSDEPDRGPSGPFRRVACRLLRAGFSGITDIHVITTVPGVAGNALLNILVAGFWSRGTDAVVVARSSVAALESKTMLPLATALINAVEPEYGIGYVRDSVLGPAFYGMGVWVRPAKDNPFDDKSSGAPPPAEPGPDEEQPNSHWYTIGRPNQVYRKGILREVYPWNFLNAIQLAWNVGGQSLEQWIRQDEVRGTLTPINNTLTLWRIAESARKEIRSFLRNHDIIFTLK